MNQLPENSLRTYDVTLVTSYLIGLRFRMLVEVNHRSLNSNFCYSRGANC